jgi:hypothetical protein
MSATLTPGRDNKSWTGPKPAKSPVRSFSKKGRFMSAWLSRMSWPYISQETPSPDR